MAVKLGQYDNGATIGAGTSATMQISTRTTAGATRMKNLHLDICAYQAASSGNPLIMDLPLFRALTDIDETLLDVTEGARVQYTRVALGQAPGRYIHLFLEKINIEDGYSLTLRPTHIRGTGNIELSIAGKWWEIDP